MKEAGFNCLRMSHHPMSKAMQEVCDHIGMLVMDELTDMWEHPKNINDYGQYFSDCWKEDISQMIDKDFNHPCGVLYSTGNEMTEAGTPKGAEVNRRWGNGYLSYAGQPFKQSAWISDEADSVWMESKGC